MKVVSINTCDFGSTGKIMLNIARFSRLQGYEAYTFSRNYGNKKKPAPNHYFFGFVSENFLHLLFGISLGLGGFFSFLGTIGLLGKIRKIKPDLIHLHNVHGWYVCLPILFYYVKWKKIPIVWTMHDCWNFTGRCPYFDLVKCSCWENGCEKCPYPKSSYPRSFVDSSKFMWRFKKRVFTQLNDCFIVTPSQWLADLTKKSFLKNYPVCVINNGIDLSVFRPVQSNFRKINDAVDSNIVLGVAFGWEKRKGLDVFINLATKLSPNYKIVLVGTDDMVDKDLPENIISIHRTQDQKELAEIYTAADVFVNPTREENFPTVNMEALACGTPVITFKTGGSPEIIDDTCGSVVDCDDVDALYSEVCRICNEKPYSSENCIKRSKCFDMNARFEEYVLLYDHILK